MKRTALGIAALLLLSATPCVVNAFTAIAWSQSGQKGGSVKNAPTKEAAISAAIADCKKSGGGSDCQVFKVSDEPGYVALYVTCDKTCGVTAVTGRPTPEQARADGKRECEAYYGSNCQLAQEWVEASTRTPANQNSTNLQTQSAPRADTGAVTKRDFSVANEGWDFSEARENLNDEKRTKLWYHPSTIRKNGNLVNLLVMKNFDGYQDDNGTKISSTVDKVEFDCATGKMSAFGRAFYRGRLGQGDIHRIEQYSPPLKASVGRYSLASNLFEKACGKAPADVRFSKKIDYSHPISYAINEHAVIPSAHANDDSFDLLKEQQLKSDCNTFGKCGELRQHEHQKFLLELSR